MECEKLAQEKTEMQRHYVMVSSFGCKWVFAARSDLCASIPRAVKLAHYCMSQSSAHVHTHLCSHEHTVARAYNDI